MKLEVIKVLAVTSDQFRRREEQLGPSRPCLLRGGIPYPKGIIDRKYISDLDQLRRTADLPFSSHNIWMVANSIEESSPSKRKLGIKWTFTARGTDWSALSVYKLDEFYRSSQQYQHSEAVLLCHLAVRALAGLEACENYLCLLNNNDFVSALESTPLLLCTGCLRKLQLRGYVTNVDNALRQLRTVFEVHSHLVQETRELETLASWGYS
eukprot:g75805.t1